MPFRLFANPRFDGVRTAVLPDAGFQRAKAEITAWDGYAMTPLHDLPAIARQRRRGAVSAEGRGDPLRPRQLQGSRRRLRGGLRVGRRTGTSRRGAGGALGRPGSRQLSPRHRADHRHLRHRRQSRPRRGLGCAALPLRLRDLRPRGRQPGAGGRDRPLRRGGAPRARHLRRRGARGGAAGGGERLVRRVGHVVERLHRGAAADHAGLSADGRRGGRPMGRCDRRHMYSSRVASAVWRPRSRRR